MADAELRASFSGVWPELLDALGEDFCGESEGETFTPTRSIGRTSSATPGRGLYPLAGSTAVGVTPGGVTIGIGAGTASFP